MDLKNRVEQISALITELRYAAGDGPKTRALVDSLFRSVHSFKAAAAAEGLVDLSRAAHEFENLLHSLRTGKLTLDDELLRVLDQAAAALRAPTVISAPTSLNEQVRDDLSDRDGLPPEFSGLKDEERHRALAAMREGSNLYRMEISFAATDFDERFRKLKERLEENAELISTSATMKDDQILFQVVYASKTEKIRVQKTFEKALLAGKAAANVLGKHVQFIVRADELLFDLPLSEALSDVLVHLVRNAVDHGIESQGTVLIEANDRQITVSDDGRGIDPQHLALLFQPGFSTAREVTEVSGRGVGLDVVKTTLEELGCSVSVTSEPGKGSSFQIKISGPITLPSPSSDA